MHLETAVEVIKELRESQDGIAHAALGVAIVELREKLEAIRDKADEVLPMIDRVLPARDRAERRAVWRHLRPMLRLSAAVLDEVERRMGFTG